MILALEGSYDRDANFIGSDEVFRRLHVLETRREWNDYCDVVPSARKLAVGLLLQRRLVTAYMVSCNQQMFHNKAVNLDYVCLERLIQLEAGLKTLGCVIEPCPWLDSKAKRYLPSFL